MVMGVPMVIGIIVFAGVMVIPSLRSSSINNQDLPQAIKLKRSFKDNMQIKVCNAPDCVHAASEILKKMNDKIDPCEDFYEFSCGSFEKHTKVPDDKIHMSTFDKMADIFDEQIISLLQEPIQPDDLNAYVFIKSYYQICTNESAIEDLGVNPLLNILRSNGGWPVLEGDNWDKESFIFEKMYSSFKKSGITHHNILEVNIRNDPKDKTKHAIAVNEGSVFPSREILLGKFDDPLIQSYYTSMVETAVALGADETRAKNDLKDALLFQISLAKITASSEEKRNSTQTNNSMTIGQLQRDFPKISWLEIINGFLAPTIQVGLDELVCVDFPKYLMELQFILEKTPKRVLANSMLFDIVVDYMEYSNAELRKISFKFMTALTGKNKETSRSVYCKSMITSNLFLEAGIASLYVKKKFNKKTKTNVMKIVKNIRDEFRKTLAKVEWINSKTKKAAFDKLDKMSLRVAYTDELLDDNNINKLFEKYQTVPNMLLETVLNLERTQSEFLISHLRKSNKDYEWITNNFKSLSTNAYYSIAQNFLSICMGFLLDLMFSSNYPAYYNYAAIGITIGHEITHGFDNQGSQFDGNGNLVNWWDEDSKNLFLDKAKCIMEQYSNYTVQEVGTKINGINTLGENIADNGGLNNAYNAYLSWTQLNGEEPTLPGLEKYSARQLFWIIYGSIYCSKTRLETLKNVILQDIHSPDHFRIIGTVSNNEMFSKDFNCPLGSPMNPKKKCQVW